MFMWNKDLKRDAGPAEADAPARYWLWIDGVGGYLVCEQREVTLGQATPEPQPVDVPLMGDISRQHARLWRDGESYLIEPCRGAVRLDGHAIAGPCSLTPDGLIELGAGGVQLKFRRPHPCSSTARLDFASRHRTQPSSDAVLLLADSCLLGPSNRCHVQCLDWSRDVVLYRRGQELFCRTTRPVEIDGIEHVGGGKLTRHSRVVGEDFAFCLEPWNG